MKDLQGLALSDFETKGNIILGKVEVDKDGSRNFTELEGVTHFDIQSNITNLFLKTCAKTFTIELLNTDDEYSLFDKGKSKYDYIKQGRRVKLYIGIRTATTETEIEVTEDSDTFNSQSEDGAVCQGHDIYNTAWADTSGVAVVDTDVILGVGQGYVPNPDEDYVIYRGVLFFNTSSIPSNATITKVTLKLYKNSEQSIIQTDFDLVIQNIDRGTGNLEIADYDKSKYSGNLGSKNTSEITGDAYTDIELDISSITKEGITLLGLRSGEDINGIAPTTIDLLAIQSSEGDNPPQLYVEWETSEEVKEEVPVDDYYWSWIYGIIDNVSTTKSANSETCSITGRDYVAYLSENYLKNLFWGRQAKYNIVAEKEKYDMPSTCKGIYRAFLYNESTEEYDELTLNSEFTYDWEDNQFVFLHPRVPFENKTNGLWVYYFTAQTVENVVADLLIEAGLLTHSEKQSWLANTDLVTPTGKTIDRVWFDSGTSYIDAIELLTERAIYRFGVTNLGKPFFKTIPVLLSDTAKRLNDGEYMVRNIEDRIDELYNHFYLIGEEREMKRINLGVMEHDVEDLTSSGVTLIGTVLADGKTSARQKELFGGSSIITSKGFKWQKEGEAEQSWSTTNSDMGLFTHAISGLDSGSRYSWLVWAKNSLGHYAESNWNTFVTPEIEEE